MTRPLLKQMLYVLPVAVLTLAMMGCTSKYRMGPLKEVDISYGGSQPMALWEALPENTEGKDILLSQTQSTWLFPFSLYNRELYASPGGDSAWAREITWNDLGLPGLNLPLRYYYAKTFYEDGSTEPTGKQGIYGWLFYADDFESGNVPDGYTFQAEGVPIVYSSLSVEEEGKSDLFFWNSLWSLGPAFFSVKSTTATDDLSVKLFIPALLLGMPGAILWGDLIAETPSEGSYISMHGPLFGALGYVSFKNPRFEFPNAEEGEEPTAPIIVGTRGGHSILTGLVWTDVYIRDIEGNLNSSRTGPLWSAFGWQTKEGRFGLRVLWIPIQF